MFLYDGNSFDWSHLWETFFGGLGACATAGAFVYGIYTRGKDARDKAAKDLESKQEQRHNDNQRVLGDITSLLKFVRPHRHREISGNLTKEGIEYGPENGSIK